MKEGMDYEKNVDIFNEDTVSKLDSSRKIQISNFLL